MGGGNPGGFTTLQWSDFTPIRIWAAKKKKIRLSGLLNSVVEREVGRYGWIWKEFKVNMINVVSMINTVKYIVQ